MGGFFLKVCGLNLLPADESSSCISGFNVDRSQIFAALPVDFAVPNPDVTRPSSSNSYGTDGAKRCLTAPPRWTAGKLLCHETQPVNLRLE